MGLTKGLNIHIWPAGVTLSSGHDSLTALNNCLHIELHSIGGSQS